MRETNKTVLVVDDEPIIRLLLHDVLAKDGYCVVESADGTSAIDLFNAHLGEIALVLLDLKLPDLDGESVLTELREIDEGIQVVVITGNLNVDDIEGAFATIRKPFNIPRLRETVQAAMR